MFEYTDMTMLNRIFGDVYLDHVEIPLISFGSLSNDEGWFYVVRMVSNTLVDKYPSPGDRIERIFGPVQNVIRLRYDVGLRVNHTEGMNLVHPLPRSLIPEWEQQYWRPYGNGLYESGENVSFYHLKAFNWVKPRGVDSNYEY